MCAEFAESKLRNELMIGMVRELVQTPVTAEMESVFVDSQKDHPFRADLFLKLDETGKEWAVRLSEISSIDRQALREYIKSTRDPQFLDVATDEYEAIVNGLQFYADDPKTSV